MDSLTELPSRCSKKYSIARDLVDKLSDDILHPEIVLKASSEMRFPPLQSFHQKISLLKIEPLTDRLRDDHLPALARLAYGYGCPHGYR